MLFLSQNAMSKRNKSHMVHEELGTYFVCFLYVCDHR